MVDLKKVFDVSKLSEHELGCVEFVLNSPAYTDVFRPYLESMRETLNLALLDPSNSRKQDFSDDFLRGNIVAIKGLLEFFEHVIRETQMQRIDESQRHLSPIGLYDRDQREGRHDPILGANEPLGDPDNPRYEPAPNDPGGINNPYLPPEEDY